MEEKYNHQSNEQSIQTLWDTQQTYDPKHNPGTPYTIDTPPPTISGSLHIGHIFSYTQTDVIARYKRMSGFSVFYPFGFDDNGLPTERYVEKKRDVSAHKIGRSEFIKVCLEETKLAAAEFTELWKRMGISADWNKTYSTISDETRKISQESFIRLYEKNFIYRKNEPAPYCTTCRTSVAQAELDDLEEQSFFNNIVFKDNKGNDLVIGTTRPELLSSCVALFYNPEDERYQHLKDQLALVPLFNYQVPIYPDSRVSIEKGTGLVMCCTFGDSTDIAWYKDFNLSYKPSIGRDGVWLPETGILAGKKVTDARKTILEALAQQNLLISQQAITHSIHIHERCKKPIEYLMLAQWFLNLMDYKQTFIDLAEEIVWYPAFMKTRYLDWVQNIKWDWCLSRQRFFGIPFPAWHCQECNAIIVANLDDLPIDPQETPYDGTCSCGSSFLLPDTDVMDTWNTSSLTPYICYNLLTNKNPFPDHAAQNFIPMSMRPQAHDIIRTWAFDTIVKVWMHNDTIPWKDIVISGHVLSGSKEKLSKSKGEKAITPQALLEQYPADAIRYWTASGSLGYDTAFSDAQLKIGQRLTTKLWNAARFIKEHTKDISSVSLQDNNNVGAINQWLLHEATQCFSSYDRHFKQYEFSLALEKAEKFFWHAFCDNYLELIKNQLFNPQEYSESQVIATKATLYHVGLRILQLYAPFIPHVTERLYQELYQSKTSKLSLHQTRFADIQHEYHFNDAAKLINTIIALVTQVRKLKTTQQLSLKTPLQTLTITGPDNLISAIKTEEALLRGVSQAIEINYVVDTQQTSDLKQDGSLWHAKIYIE